MINPGDSRENSVSKQKLAGIIVVCTIAIIAAIVLINLRPWERAYTLNVIVNPPQAGSVSLSPTGGEYEAGQQVILTAIPASGYILDYWGGAASGSSNVVIITMDSSKTAIAYFSQSDSPPSDSAPPDSAQDYEQCAPGSVPWYEAQDHIGERITICGSVVDATWASGSNGKPTFLNLGEPYPDPDRFTVVIWIQYRTNFPQSPENYYLGTTICVTGLVTEYAGIPEIEARSPSDIEICEP